MKRVFAFIGGRSRVGQSTIAAELAFEWVKRGASACVLTTRRQIDAMGYDCFELPGLGAPAGRVRDPGALAEDLAQLEDYDYFILDLPPTSVDLAVAAALSGADLVVPMHIEQGTLAEVSGMFKELARRPPPSPIHLVLNQVRNPAAATEAAERLITSIGSKLRLPARLAATLPWDPDLAAMAKPSSLLSLSLPTAALVGAIPQLADALGADGAVTAPAPVAMVFWEQLQRLLQQPQGTVGDQGPPPSTTAAQRPLDLTAPVATPAFRRDAAAGDLAAPAVAAELARIAAGLEQLGKEVGTLRKGLAAKFEFADDAADGRAAGAGAEPIRLDFEDYRRRHSGNGKRGGERG